MTNLGLAILLFESLWTTYLKVFWPKCISSRLMEKLLYCPYVLFVSSFLGGLIIGMKA